MHSPAPSSSPSSSSSSSKSNRKVLLFLIFGGLALILFWLLILNAAMNSILSQSSSSSPVENSVLANKLHQHHTNKEGQVAPIIDEEVHDPITEETIRKLKTRIRELEDILAHGGGKSAGNGNTDNNNVDNSDNSVCSQLRKELIETIQAERELQKQLGILRNENQLLKKGNSKKKAVIDNNNNDDGNVEQQRPTPTPPSHSENNKAQNQKTSIADEQEGNAHRRHNQQQPPENEQEDNHQNDNNNHNDDNNVVMANNMSPFPAERSGGRIIKGPGNDPSHDPHGTIPIIVFSYNRAKLVDKLLKQIQELLMSGEQKHKRLPPFRVFVSQDLDAVLSHQDVTRVIQEAQTQTRRSLGIVYMMHNRDDSGYTAQEESNGWKSYYAISKHYAWAISQTFAMNQGYERVILLEEDLELAFDFFEFMAAMSPMFDKDPTMYCVSGFNDNGKAGLVQDSSAVYRSDFFPGLGWMMSRKLYEKELREKWPKGFWDDWMRQPAQRRGRSCLRPEISRSKPLCEDGEGASQGQFCDDHLKMIVLNDIRKSRPVHWSGFNLQTLMPQNYDMNLKNEISRARSVFNIQSIFALTSGGSVDSTEVKLSYGSNDEFMVLAHSLGLMDDFKDGVPRTAYHGIVTVKWRKNWAMSMNNNNGRGGGGGNASPLMIDNRDENPNDVRKVHLVSKKLLYVNQ